jgi:transcriptional regulator with XRE-family HTH domain
MDHQSGTYRAVVATLREARQRAGLTQQEMATPLGRPQPLVAKYERGERQIDVAEFMKIANAMKANRVRFFAAVLKK